MTGVVDVLLAGTYGVEAAITDGALVHGAGWFLFFLPLSFNVLVFLATTGPDWSVGGMAGRVRVDGSFYVMRRRRGSFGGG